MKVFLSGPMTTSGEPGPNLHEAAVAFAVLARLGHTPFMPHVAFYQDAIVPIDRKFWVDWSATWLLQCEAVLRLPGHSLGADEEVDWARAHDIPVVQWTQDRAELERRLNNALELRRAADRLDKGES